MRRIWDFLTLSTLVIASWFTFTAMNQLYAYKQMSAKSAVQVSTWEVEPLSSGYYTVRANFSFEPKGHPVKMVSKSQNTLFINEHAAKEHIQKIADKTTYCFYSPKKPQICALERSFPLKALIHMGITLLVSLYFLFVRRYVKKYEETKSVDSL